MRVYIAHAGLVSYLTQKDLRFRVKHGMTKLKMDSRLHGNDKSGARFFALLRMTDRKFVIKSARF